MATTTKHDSSLSSGISGLDEILRGGISRDRLFLVEGAPGSGKTTLALQFLIDGVAQGETVMFVALSESLEELEASAASHGWSLAGIHLFALPTGPDLAGGAPRSTMFHSSEIELAETMKSVLAEFESVRPTRLVFDSLSEFRLLSESPLRYRRQILALKQFFASRQCTVLLIDDRGDRRDTDLHSLVHGVIQLERVESEYGAMRRRLSVTKLRGRAFREGYHDFVIGTGGLRVFPRLVAVEHHADYPREALSTGLAQVDLLLGGGFARGTSTLILGPSGTGKSSLTMQSAVSVAKAGKDVSIFLFEEAMATYLERARGLGIELEQFRDEGRARIRQVDPAEMAPGEFAAVLMEEVRRDGIEMVVIDSLNGFLNAMPNERFLMLHLHELLTYLGQLGVTTLMTLTQHGIVNGAEHSPVDASYLADTVVLLRYFEAFGEVRQALSVIKKRTGTHERSIRELRFDRGLKVGEPVREFQGVLTGVPQPLPAFDVTPKAR